MSFQTEMVFACCLTSDLRAGRVSGPRFFARARAAREAFPRAGRAPAAPGVVRDVERHEPALALELVHEQAEARRELRGPEIVVRGDLRAAGPLREGLHGRPPRAAGAAGDVTGGAKETFARAPVAGRGPAPALEIASASRARVKLPN
jgi:hypothetical protein